MRERAFSHEAGCRGLGGQGKFSRCWQIGLLTRWERGMGWAFRNVYGRGGGSTVCHFFLNRDRRFLSAHSLHGLFLERTDPLFRVPSFSLSSPRRCGQRLKLVVGYIIPCTLARAVLRKTPYLRVRSSHSISSGAHTLTRSHAHTHTSPNHPPFPPVARTPIPSRGPATASVFPLRELVPPSLATATPATRMFLPPHHTSVLV